MDKIKNNQQKNWYSGIRASIVICFIAISLVSIFGLLLKNVAYAQYGGGGSGFVDYTAPSISNIKVVVSAKSAKITWITDEPSVSWVIYGLTTAYGSELKTPSHITSHSLTLPNLTPSTAYHYSVKSKDGMGNIGAYADQTFTTLALGEEPKIEKPITEKPITEITVQELEAKIIETQQKIIDLLRQLIQLIQQQIQELST